MQKKISGQEEKAPTCTLTSGKAHGKGVEACNTLLNSKQNTSVILKYLKQQFLIIFQLHVSCSLMLYTLVLLLIWRKKMGLDKYWPGSMDKEAGHDEQAIQASCLYPHTVDWHMSSYTTDNLTTVASTGSTPTLSLHYSTACGAEAAEHLSKLQFLSATYPHQCPELKFYFSQKERVCNMNPLVNCTYWN